MFDGAGDDLAFKSGTGPLLKCGVLPGGRVGELMLDEGPGDSVGCVVVIINVTLGGRSEYVRDLHVNPVVLRINVEQIKYLVD